MPLKISNEELPTINLTSMIDVLFLLIIFFMVGTRFSESEHQINLTLPKSNRVSANLPGPPPKVVKLFADGTIELDGQMLDLNQLTQSLAQQVRNYPDLSVQLKPDARCTVAQEGMLYDAINNAGVRAVAYTYKATQMPNVQRR